MSELLDDIHRLRVAFLRLNLEPPEAILLRSSRDGFALMHHLSGAVGDRLVVSGGALKQVTHPDGSVWMEFQFMGLSFRYPAGWNETRSEPWLFCANITKTLDTPIKNTKL